MTRKEEDGHEGHAERHNLLVRVNDFPRLAGGNAGTNGPIVLATEEELRAEGHVDDEGGKLEDDTTEKDVSSLLSVTMRPEIVWCEGRRKRTFSAPSTVVASAARPPPSACTIRQMISYTQISKSTIVKGRVPTTHDRQEDSRVKSGADTAILLP